MNAHKYAKLKRISTTIATIYQSEVAIVITSSVATAEETCFSLPHAKLNLIQRFSS